MIARMDGAPSGRARQRTRNSGTQHQGGAEAWLAGFPFARRKHVHVKGIGVATFFAMLLSTIVAQGASTGGALLVGYGFDKGYKFGLGIRGGVTAPSGVYVGGTLLTHAGWTGVKIEQYHRPQTDVYYGGVEGGWEFSIDPLVVRPYVGVGYGLVHSSTMAVCTANTACFSGSSNDGAFALFPGVVALTKLGIVVVGADVRYVLLIGTGYENAVGAFGTAGLSF